MGLSTTSPVASRLITSTKQSLSAHEEEKGRTFASLAKRMAAENIDDAVATRGQLVLNRRPEAALWAVMFRGEETGSAAHLDLGKMQLFYFTLALVLADAVALGTAFASRSARIGQLPVGTPGWWRCWASAMRAT